ncbi:hypothetical protein L210DRAFT_3614995 [Boletus edulis BED1]|uniref:Uncharacterized protein n=1 Tax=Boletus edulis BED1 TaxID=1328754 RepID=A0AAD4BFQ7_BOLED|nr:hypothetical protein L210DRAFT_3614995 [Boletus edulis BED1]
MSAPAYRNPAADGVASTYLPTLRSTSVESHVAPPEEPAPPLLPSASKTEKFLLTAAGQESKYEAGLLKLYDCQILQPLSVLRPKFRDLVFIEEAFERLLLDYDCVFSIMGVPACLWR